MNGKINYFENIEKPAHGDFVAAQTKCVLCNSELELTHEKVEGTDAIREEAHCTQCELRNRRKVYAVH